MNDPFFIASRQRSPLEIEVYRQRERFMQFALVGLGASGFKGSPERAAECAAALADAAIAKLNER